MNFGLSSETRLTSRKDYGALFESGQKVVGKNMILWYRRTPGEGIRLGLSTSSKVGISVRRNRLKRLVRESYRLSRGRLIPGLDMVAYIRPGCRWETLADAQREFLDLCARAKLLAA